MPATQIGKPGSSRSIPRMSRNSESRDPGHSLLEIVGVEQNTAAATTQVRSPRGAPWAAATMECVSTIRLLIS